MSELKSVSRCGFVWASLCIIFILSFSGPVFSAEEAKKNTSAVNEELEGFDDEFEGDDPFALAESQSLKEEISEVKNSAFRVAGFVKIESEYAFDKADEKLSKLKPLLFLQTEYRISENYKLKVSGQGYYDASYNIEAKDEISGASLDDEKSHIELKDLYIDVTLGQIFSLRAGRQIVAWGESDYARITDVVNPRDLTQPGLIDLEDARIQTTAIRLSAIFDAWSFEAVGIHEHPGSKLSGSGSDFDYYISLRNPGLAIKDKDTPDFGIEDSTFAAKATYTFNGGDISFIAAHTFDDQPILSYNGLDGIAMVFTPEYKKMTTLGVSSSFAQGQTLFKIETAYIMGKEIMRDDFLEQIISGIGVSDVKTHSKKDVLSGLAGFDYTGFSNLRLTFEVQLNHILDHQTHLSEDENEVLSYFQATKDLLNETLELDLFWVHMIPGDGNILRLSAEYDIYDDLSLQAGVIFYDSSSPSSDLDPYKDRDRVFIRMKYSF